MKKKCFYILISLISLTISGCSSFGKGITEAIINKQEEADTRICEVWGESFTGLKPHLETPDSKMKVLMIHGVGDHAPGYSTEFFEKLSAALGLTVTVKKYKNITLADPDDPEKALGNLRINRFLDLDQTQELLFYELTWSEITASEKEVLAYDNSGEYSFRRAEVNNLLKQFSNDTGPDPIIYLGDKREDILTSVAQSFCWMTFGDWDALPTDEKLVCQSPDALAIENDQYAFVSHSLGSRITIDSIQRIASILTEDSKQNDHEKAKVKSALQNKEIPIYMMSNQLPMLQLGRKLPVVSKHKAAYCQVDGAKYDQRLVAKMPIIAFSDPNDILSYALSRGFEEKYLDSRLCIDITNIIINVAFVYDVFGLGSMANPMEAHIGYDTDDRVIALIANGIGHPRQSELVKDRCRWIKTID